MTIKWLLDPGHGIDTPGKRSPFIPPGIREYEFNRAIATWIYYWLVDDSEIIVNQKKSVSLKERCLRANVLHRMAQEKSQIAFMVSIHANAAGNGKTWNKARGTTVFVAPRADNLSIQFANTVGPLIAEALGTRWRGVKKASFKVLRGTDCPSVLIEYGFMTNKEEAIKLASDSYREQMARATRDAILTFERSRQ